MLSIVLFFLNFLFPSYCNIDAVYFLSLKMSLFEDVCALQSIYYIRAHVSRKIELLTLEFFLAIKGEEKGKTKIYVESVCIYLK